MDNKEKILNCALDLFHARGYDAVGVQELAEMAGVTKPTLYYYFGNKQGLLKELLSREYEIFKHTVFKENDPDERVWRTLPRIAAAYIDYAMDHRKAYMLMMALFYSARENEAYQVVRPFAEDLYQQMVQIFSGASDQLGNMNGRQEQFALGFTGMLDHYMLLMSARQSEDFHVPPETKEALAKQFMHGIFS
ncbi:MAG: TetR/AcrR family transcriptional regulator [Oscillospiraceae bacterium]|nr:TetR/AcrR family transcriptional regulator [Oscillospiraceae bacterium]